MPLTATPAAPISIAVEGNVDAEVAQRLVREVGGNPGPVYGRNGKAQLLQKLGGYNNAARFSPWLVLVDLDGDAACPPLFLDRHLPQRSGKMCCRVAVQVIEAWLLADTERFARFLSVPITRLPINPEEVENPKEHVLSLARRSRRSAIREDMVPRPGSRRAEGPAYTSRLIQFAQGAWRPNVAAQRSESLSRCLDCLRELVDP